MAINWDVSGHEDLLIKQIAARGYAMASKAGIEPASLLIMEMDITACHANGCPLRLQEFLDANDSNFAHDFFGIRRHIDRSTGKLTGHFDPRFSQAGCRS